MKPIIRISVLVLALLLLSGCSNQAASNREYKATANKKLPFPTDMAEPTEPAETASTETATMPTVTTQPTTVTPTTPEPTTPVTQNTPAATAGYGAVYAEIYRFLQNPDQEQTYQYVGSGIMEIVYNSDSYDERVAGINYALEDIDQDGIREMVVVDSARNTRILGIYTLQNGQPLMTHEGWARSRLYRLNDSTIYSEGSSGAAYSSFGVNGQLWFTYPKDEAQAIPGYYYAADGKYDPTTAQEITFEEYFSKQEELSKRILAFSTYSFS